MDTENTFNEYWKKYESKIKGIIKQKYAISSDFRSNLFDDLLQVARLSLYQVIKSFDTKKASNSNDSFWTYAKKRIEGSLKDELSRNTGAVFAPLRIKQLAIKLQKLQSEDESTSQIAAKLHCRVAEVERAIEYLRFKDAVSIETPLYNDNQGKTILAEILQAEPTFTQDLLSENFLKMLNSREKKVARLLVAGYSTLEVIRKMKTSREVVINIGNKLKGYLKVEKKKLEVVDSMNNRQLSKEKYDELKAEQISDKEIAKKYKISIITLRSKKKEWNPDLTVPPSVIVENKQETISTEQYKKLSDAYERLKTEYESLWKYHRLSLLRMESPFDWQE